MRNRMLLGRCCDCVGFVDFCPDSEVELIGREIKKGVLNVRASGVSSIPVDQGPFIDARVNEVTIAFRLSWPLAPNLKVRINQVVNEETPVNWATFIFSWARLSHDINLFVPPLLGGSVWDDIHPGFTFYTAHPGSQFQKDHMMYRIDRFNDASIPANSNVFVSPDEPLEFNFNLRDYVPGSFTSDNVRVGRNYDGLDPVTNTHEYTRTINVDGSQTLFENCEKVFYLRLGIYIYFSAGPFVIMPYTLDTDLEYEIEAIYP